MTEETFTDVIANQSPDGLHLCNIFLWTCHNKMMML